MMEKIADPEIAQGSDSGRNLIEQFSDFHIFSTQELLEMARAPNCPRRGLAVCAPWVSAKANANAFFNVARRSNSNPKGFSKLPNLYFFAPEATVETQAPNARLVGCPPARVIKAKAKLCPNAAQKNSASWALHRPLAENINLKILNPNCRNCAHDQIVQRPSRQTSETPL